MIFSSQPSRRAICVIGAGPSGLTVCKNLLQAGLAVECFEREDDVGGNWYYGRKSSSVCSSTHLISSKRLTEYTDFPMPADYPAYPSHQQVLSYLRAYARQFDLYPAIQFGTSVERVEPAGNAWQVTVSGGQVRIYDGVVIANGHHWNPQWPKYPGQFTGRVLHSSEYKTPDVLRDQRVLVVGAGNSGCDIAVESAQNAARTCHSMRRGYHYLPKFLFGKPIDLCGERLLRWRLPLGLRRWITARFVKAALGRPQDYGLPEPDHKLLETHPIINSQMLYYVGHGKIQPKPDIAELDGREVRFVDGTQEEFDVLVYATGFQLSFPFISDKYLNIRDGVPQLFLNVFHPQHSRLFVVGMIQPDSGLWGLADYQAQLVARYLVALDQNPANAARLDALKSQRQPDLADGIHYVASPRHRLEVEHFSYRRRLQKLIVELT